MIRTVEEARAWRAKMNIAIKTIPDADASEAVELYPQMHNSGDLIPYKTRINFGGRLMQAKQDLWDLESNSPDNLPGSWTWIRYKNGYRYINDVMYGDEAFSVDEIGYYESTDKFYKSLINNNTWNPAEYAAGWEAITV